MLKSFGKSGKLIKNPIDTILHLCYSKKCTIMARYAYSAIS